MEIENDVNEEDNVDDGVNDQELHRIFKNYFLKVTDVMRGPSIDRGQWNGSQWLEKFTFWLKLIVDQYRPLEAIRWIYDILLFLKLLVK